MLFISFIYLFQTVDNARQLLKYLDEDLGTPLPEQSYGEDCRLYTPGHPKGAFHNFLVGAVVLRSKSLSFKKPVPFGKH